MIGVCFVDLRCQYACLQNLFGFRQYVSFEMFSQAGPEDFLFFGEPEVNWRSGSLAFEFRFTLGDEC